LLLNIYFLPTAQFYRAMLLIISLLKINHSTFIIYFKTQNIELRT